MDYIEEPYGCAVSISYPVHFADGSLWLSAEVPKCAWLDAEGLHVRGPRGAETVPWADITDLRVIGPVFSGRWWSAVQLVLELVAPINLRSRQTRIEYETSRDGWHYLELPSTPRRRFSYRNLDAFEAMVETLHDEGSLRLLIDSTALPRLLATLPAHTSWITPRTHSRVRRAVLRLLTAADA